MQPPRPLISSPPDFLEALAFSTVIFLYIWRWQTAGLYTWLVFPIWLLVSFVLHRDTPKTLGWRADNLKAAARIAAPVFLMFIAGIVLAGVALGGLHRLPAHLVEPRRFVGYFAFCVLQQVGLQSMTMNRVPLTFIGGAAMCWLFSRERNILPLVLGQAILGALVFWAFPIAWHHAMRVGPGYYSFRP